MNAVVTVTIGDKFEKMAKYTHPLIKAYAERIGAEFIVLNEQSQLSPTPHFEKCQIFHLLNKYERIIYVDTDCLIKASCPNLFEVVPENKFGAFNEGAFCERAPAFKEASLQYNISIQGWKGKYYNTGVMVISRIHKFLFKRPDQCIINFFEQSYINLLIFSNKVEVLDLDSDLNRMSCMDMRTGLHRLNSEIIHYAGAPETMDIFGLIQADIKAIKGNTYSKKRNILYRPQGGLGDVICSEPTIRFLINTLYKDSNLVIETHFPRIFAHLKCPIFFSGNFRPENDTPYYIINSMTEPEHISWQFMSVNLMHTIDFVSLLSCRRILTDMEKQINLAVTLDDITEISDIVGLIPLNELVLVHLGTGWASKTLPNEYWSELINALVQKGHKVALIGKYLSEEQKLINIEFDKEKVYDLRNLTSIGGLIGIISQAKVLITNDSAPLHIAGAFDNEVILIPTCKHPDWCLPYRKGSKLYKSKALYKNLLCDRFNSAPTNVNGESVDKVIGNYSEFLPDVSDVLSALDDMEK